MIEGATELGNAEIRMPKLRHMEDVLPVLVIRPTQHLELDDLLMCRLHLSTEAHIRCNELVQEGSSEVDSKVRRQNISGMVFSESSLKDY